MTLAVLNVPVNDMQVGVEETFDFLSKDYRDFYAGGRGTAFQAPLWLDRLHRHLGAALGARQRTVTVRRADDGSLLAVLPMVLQRASGISILQPADFGVSDYNAIVADQETFECMVSSPPVRKALRKALKGADLLMLRKIRSDGLDVGRLFDGARQSPGENSAFSFELGDDFDHWRLKVMNRNFTKELGRLQRQTEKEHGLYVHRAIDDEAEIHAAFDFLRRAREDRFDDNLLNRPDYFEFYRDYAVAAAKTGEAITYVSYLAGEPVAVLFGLAGDGAFHATLIAADLDRYRKISGGMQILYRVIEQRHRHGHRSFDMCLGNPGYKSHFRPVETPMRNVTLSLSLRGMAVATIYHHAKPLKNLLRKGVSNVR